jgi:hypothetical protein
VQKSVTDDLVYRTHAQTEQALPSAVAGPEWNAWVEAHLEAHDRILTESIGRALAHERQLRRTEAETELAPLRRELAELQGQVSVLLTLLEGTKADAVPLPGGRKLSAS